MKLGSGC
nr:unnamed protein product [unidentified cloning vector]